MRNELEKFTAKSIKEVEKILLEDLAAIKVSREDERLKYHLQDPTLPIFKEFMSFINCHLCINSFQPGY